MRRIASTRIAALASALVAGALAAFVLRPSLGATTGSAAHVQQPATEVRTQVIRRTIHIVRHERPPRDRAPRGASAAGGATVVASVGAAPRTATSGSRVAATGAPAGVSAPRTRTSGASTGLAPATGSTGAPARTRTSGGSGGSSPAAGTVRTRTSGGGGDGGDHGQGHDD